MSPTLFAQDRPLCVIKEEIKTSNVNSIAFQDIKIEDKSFVDAEDINFTKQLTNPKTSQVNKENKTVTANYTEYDDISKTFSLKENVIYQDASSKISSQTAEFSYTDGTILFDEAEFQLNKNNSRGNAKKIQITRNGELLLSDVKYTTCPIGSNDWNIEAKNIEINTEDGIGKANNLALRFKGIPILYAPQLTFPIGDIRKTGFLAPEIGNGGRNGNEIRLPWYWNIAENYDATLTPRILTSRGIQYGTEFRYLTERNEGNIQIEYLANDTQFGESRYNMSLNHSGFFKNGWRTSLDYNQASDGQYFEDLGGSLNTTSITHLNKSAIFDIHKRNWSLSGRFQDYQTIDEDISLTDRPYRRLPQINATITYPQKPLGIQSRTDIEVVYFDRKIGVTGWRSNAEHQIDWSIKNSGWFINPNITLQHTQYNLKKHQYNQYSNTSRTLPIISFDAGMFFERSINDSGKWIQTLEPRLLYLNTPYRDQSHIPIFDTIEPDLNLVQLFRKNRFVGKDRIADAKQISVGLTTRLMNKNSGKEAITASIGQAIYLNDQKVSLPNQNLISSNSSDYVAELHFLLYKNFNFDYGHQWGSNGDGVKRSQARLQYRPASNKIINLGYSFRRGSLEQTDLSWSWPVSDTWNFVGRYNYSLRDNKALEQFYGLEYENCCWGLRLVYRQYLSTRNGLEDSSFGLQLILKGLANIGARADRLLERGILGYSHDFE